MTRYGKTFLVAAALVCAGLLSGWSVARGAEGPEKRGSVLFYAGFDESKDADYAIGDAKARDIEGGGTLNADGLGFRGSALRTGDAEGYVDYAAKGNINPEEGTIEFWIYAQDWDPREGEYHRFFNVTCDGEISFRIRPPGVGDFVVRSTKTTASRANGSNVRKGKWHWYALTWKKDERLGFYIGAINASSGKIGTHDNSSASGPTPVVQNLQRIQLGDFRGRVERRVNTLIDEVYIYDRALTREEVDWAAANSRTRERGMDIPGNFMQPKTKVVPDPGNKTLVVEVDTGDRSGDFAGLARLEPAAGTSPAPITATKSRFGQAVIPFTDLPQGDYNVICDITTKAGKPVASVTTKFVVPGPPVWLDEKVGVSDTPPPLWTPIVVKGDSVKMWGRDYRLGAFGLPAKVETQGASILSGPIDFRTVSDGSKVSWKEEKRDVVSKTDAAVVLEGTSRSSLGELSWRTQAEYDGFLLHDFSLTPAAGAAVELMELRIPIHKEFALLYSKGSRARGFLPKGEGEILSAGAYWWIGTDDIGFCGANEHNGSLIKGADGAFSIVRDPDGDITVIYRFAGKQTALKEPWELRLILQATPTKPLPANWRTWRTPSPFTGPADPVYAKWRNTEKLWVAYPWPHEKAYKHFAFPVVKDPNWYRNHVKNLHAGGPGMWRDTSMLDKPATAGVKTKSAGNRVLPYSMLAFMAPGMPECDYYWREWFNPLAMSSLGSGLVKYAAVRPVPSYIDFVAWKHRELIREYGHDGLYIDFAGSCQPALAVEHGLGYVRGGVEHPVGFPIVATRELWKRVYTMLRQEKPNGLIFGHTSENSCVPILSFLDIWLPGEGNWFGQLKDDYLEVLPLDQLRAEFRAQHFGGAAWWLPAWQRAAKLEDKDVASRRADGSVGIVSVEKTHHMLGIGLLLDMHVWPICGTNQAACNQLYPIQDEFDMGDVEFFGYWNNTDIIGGQDEAVKASAYRKAKGGALVVVYNTSRETRTQKLAVDWDKLKSDAALEVFDAFTKEPLAVNGSSLTLDVPRLNYRLLWVR